MCYSQLFRSALIHFPINADSQNSITIEAPLARDAALFDLLKHPQTRKAAQAPMHIHYFIQYQLKRSLKEATLNKSFIMSRTRNRITIARGTIADNARRQMSLMNKCQMPGSTKRDYRFMNH